MSEILIIIVVASGAFIGTNLDNLLLLMAMYSRYEQNAVIVTAGYFAGMLLIGAISLLIGEAGELLPLAYLGFLGVIPISIGVISLWKLFRKAEVENLSRAIETQTGVAVFLTLVVTQLSNSADSIVTFSALFADSSDAADYLIAPTFLAMTIVFSGTAYYSLKHHRLKQFVNRYGKYVTPFILILVGWYIFSNTGLDLVPG